MSLTHSDVRKYLSGELRVDLDGVSDSAPLFSSGLIDSFALVSLLTWFEERVGSRIPPLDVTLENMDSVDRLVAYARRMRDDGA